MICKSCNIEFDNINGLKFCPYCGAKITEPAASKVVQTPDRVFEEKEVLAAQEEVVTSEEEVKTRKFHDTLEMPAITDKDIRKYKRNKFITSFRKTFLQRKVIIPLLTAMLVIGVGAVAYSFLSAKPADEARIKEDLAGKVITLPKGTNIEIKKGYIKSLSITSRNTNKNEKKDDIKAAVTINNGILEVRTMLSLQYIYEGKNQWKINDKIALDGDASIKPLVVMEEKQFLEGLKKLSINVGDTAKPLGGDDVKTLRIAERTPDLDNLKEDILVEASIDSGVVAANGKIKCKLNFANEAWGLTSIEKNSPDDFKLTLSPSFSQDKIVDAIKKEGLDETVTNANVFGGKGFYVRDTFTKSINISDKKFDDQKGTLTVTAKRENAAGELKSTLSTDYTFAVSFTKMDLIKKSKATVDSVTIDEISRDLIVSTITNVEIEGGNIFFWFADNHKITADEAKTFKLDKTLAKKGFQNVKYVYGSITYADGNKQKTTAVVATYYLVYDSSKGYSWKLEKIIGEDSPNYKSLYPEPR